MTAYEPCEKCVINILKLEYMYIGVFVMKKNAPITTHYKLKLNIDNITCFPKVALSQESCS